MSFSTAQERRERQRGEARRAILDAAGEIVAAEGVDGLSMRRLAARCGYALPTIYNHFGDKPGLLEALLDQVFAELVGVLHDAPSSPDPVDDLRDLLRAFVEFGLGNPSHYQLLVTAIRDGSEPPAAVQARERFEAPILRLLEAGRLRGGDVEVGKQVLWAFAHGLISLRTSRADLEWAPDLLDTAMEAMLLGVLTPDPARHAQERS